MNENDRMKLCGNIIDDIKETRIRLLLKSFREQPKRLFALAIINAIRSSAKEYCYRDGTVDWNTAMKQEIDEWEDRLKQEFNGGTR